MFIGSTGGKPLAPFGRNFSYFWFRFYGCIGSTVVKPLAPLGGMCSYFCIVFLWLFCFYGWKASGALGARWICVWIRFYGFIGSTGGKPLAPFGRNGNVIGFGFMGLSVLRVVSLWRPSGALVIFYSDFNRIGFAFKFLPIIDLRVG